MFGLILAYGFILLGFVLLFIQKKSKKKDKELKVATVIQVTKKDKGYEITVRYSLDEGITFLEDTIETKRNHRLNESVIIKRSEQALTLEPGRKKMILFYVCCFLTGILILYLC